MFHTCRVTCYRNQCLRFCKTPVIQIIVCEAYADLFIQVDLLIYIILQHSVSMMQIFRAITFGYHITNRARLGLQCRYVTRMPLWGEPTPHVPCVYFRSNRPDLLMCIGVFASFYTKHTSCRALVTPVFHHTCYTLPLFRKTMQSDDQRSR